MESLIIGPEWNETRPHAKERTNLEKLIRFLDLSFYSTERILMKTLSIDIFNQRILLNGLKYDFIASHNITILDSIIYQIIDYRTSQTNIVPQNDMVRINHSGL